MTTWMDEWVGGFPSPGARRCPVQSASGAFRGFLPLQGPAPIQRVICPDGRPVWLVTRHEDARIVLGDPRFSLGPSVDPGAGLADPAWRLMNHNLLSLEGEQHSRLRRLVRDAFSVKAVESLEPRIRSTAQGLLDELRHRERIDIVSEFAEPLATSVVAEMIGIPQHARGRYRSLSAMVVRSVNSCSAADISRLGIALREFEDYLRALLSGEEASRSGTGIASALVAAIDDSGSAPTEGRLTRDEVLSMLLLLTVAGIETTASSLANGVLALLTHPDCMNSLVRDPAKVADAIPELLRYAGSVKTAFVRCATHRVTVADQVVPAGDLVLVAIASANFDEDVFPSADSLELHRSERRHLSFGSGRHHCLGSALAMAELRIGFELLLDRLPPFRLAVAPSRLQWRAGFLIRSLESLPVSLMPL